MTPVVSRDLIDYSINQSRLASSSRRQRFECALVGSRALARATGSKAPCPGAALWSEDCNAHVRRTRLVLCRDAITDGLLVAPRDHRINYAIAAAAGEVRIVEAHQPEALQVVGKAEIKSDQPANRSTRLARVLRGDRVLSVADPFLRPDPGPNERGPFRGVEGRDRSVRLGRRELDHFRKQS